MKAVSMISGHLGRIALLLPVTVISPSGRHWEGKNSTQTIIRSVSSENSHMTNFKSMNNAITSILIGKLNFLNSWRNSLHGKLRDSVEAGEGVSNQLRGSSKIDAPPSSTLP